MITTILWSPGWAYDSEAFTPLVEMLPQYHHAFVNPGYFSPAFQPDVDPETTLGAGHSLGFSKLLTHYPDLAGYVSLAGFTQFMATTDFPQGVPSPALRAMILQFRSNPHQVLADFYARCGDQKTPPGSLETEMLLADLQLMQTIYCPLPQAPLLTLAGEDDQITPLSMQRAIFSDLVVLRNAPHCLMGHHALECAQGIGNFLNRLNETENSAELLACGQNL